MGKRTVGKIRHRADRGNLDERKGMFATTRDLNTLEEAMVGADVFIGLSAGDIVSQEMVKSMAKNPIVFALANPTPEISYDLAIAARPDIIMATGRSDHPNQVKFKEKNFNEGKKEHNV